jgi:hypothetical protein
MSSFITICSLEAEFFNVGGQTDGETDSQTDGQTDVTKIIVAFHNSDQAPKNVNFFCVLK